jgi:hypothetical protein
LKDSLEGRRGFNARLGSNMMTKRAIQDPCSESEKTTPLSPRDIFFCGQPKEGGQDGRLKRLVKPLVAETTLNEPRTQVQLQQWKARLRFKIVSLPLP